MFNRNTRSYPRHTDECLSCKITPRLWQAVVIRRLVLLTPLFICQFASTSLLQELLSRSILMCFTYVSSLPVLFFSSLLSSSFFNDNDNNNNNKSEKSWTFFRMAASYNSKSSLKSIRFQTSVAYLIYILTMSVLSHFLCGVNGPPLDSKRRH